MVSSSVCWMQFRGQWSRSVYRPIRLPPHPSAIHGKDGAGHVVAGRRTEVKSRAGEILRLSPARGGDAFEDLPIASLVGLQGFRVGRSEVTGGDGIDLNTLRRPFVGERFCQLGNAAFAGGVGRHADTALEAEQRRDVNDLAAVHTDSSAWDHVATSKLRELKDARKMALNDQLPVF